MSTYDTSTETLALYAMGLLDPDERAAVDAQLRTSSATREELALVTGDLATYALTADMHSPAALMRQRLLKRVARERKPVPVQQPAKPEPAGTPFAAYAAQASGFATRNENYAEPQVPRTIRRAAPEDEERRNGFAVAMPFVSWAVAAGMAFAAFYQYNARMDAETRMRNMSLAMTQIQSDSHQARSVVETLTAPEAQRVTLMKTDSPPSGPCGKAIYLPEKGMLTFIATNLDPLQPYKTYELWLIPADGRDPIPAGTFKPDERGYASVLMPELPKGIPAKAFGVTIEDAGGAQTPTMPIVLAGA
jgi:anti-sigma-K factor RskA